MQIIKKVLIAVIALSFCSDTFAQDSKKELTFRGSLIAGMNMSQVDGDIQLGFRLPGVHAGLKVGVNFHPRWQVAMEMLFNQKGSIAPTPRTSSNGQTLKFRFNYLEIPLSINFMDWKIIDKNEKQFMRIRAQAGLSYARLFSGSLKIDQIDRSDKLYEWFNKNEFSYILGAGYGFNSHWGFEFRWQQSLIPFSRTVNGASAAPGPGNYRHRSITLSGIYTF